MRIDVRYRSDATGNTFGFVHNVSGAGTVTLTEQRFADLAALCAAIEAQLQLVDADLTCTEAAGVVTIADGNSDTFTVTWTHPRLRDWLGFSADLAGDNTYTGATSPATFVSSLPFDDPAPLGWLVSLRTFAGDHQTGGSLKLSKLTTWRTAGVVQQSDLAAFRSVMSLAMRGYGLKWWRDVAVGTAWSYSNWWGTVNVRLGVNSIRYSDQWFDTALQSHTRVSLEFIEE